MRRLKTTYRLAAILTSLLAFSPCPALAGGFEVQQSAYFQGMSFAGSAAGGPSLASISWNPAASSFSGYGLITESSLAVVLPEADLTVLNPGAQEASLSLLGIPLAPTGPAKVDMGRDALIGAGFATYRLNDKTVLGLSLTGPFGLVVKPDRAAWAGKYVALTTKLFSLNATPSLSYEIMPGVSIGGGVQLQYFDVIKLRAATPLGVSTIDADDIGVGFMAGINLNPGPGTSIGLGFRSSIHHDLQGETKIGISPELEPFGLVGTIGAPIEADIELPEKITFGLRQALSPGLRLLGTVDWTRWSRLGVIPVTLQSSLPVIPPLPAGATIANIDVRWRDGWLFAAGGEYDWSPKLTLRTGFSYEVSPVDEATTRLLQVPDSNRVWASVGATYHLGPNSSIDFAYSHGFFEDDAPFERSPASTLLAGVPALRGVADLSADIVSVGWKFRWGGASYASESLK
jgi:long-chain fatty acid transport protein